MALQVWLPLNGNLDNQGLYNKTITSSAFASNVNGKIGSCIKCSTTAAIDTEIPSSVWDFTTKSISFGAWVKINQTELAEVTSTSTYSGNYTTAGGNLLGRCSYGGLGLRWKTNNLTTNTTPTNVYMYVYIRNSSSGSRQTATIDFPFNTWVHIFVVFDRDAQTMTIFKDGQSYSSVAVNMSTYATTGNISQGNFMINWATWDGGNGNSKYAPWYINDLRIYDHALSPKEVHEIAKGLVLHYPLNDLNQTFINSFVYPTFDTSSSNGGWSHWSSSGSTHSFSQNTSKEYIYNKNNTYSHKFANTSGSYSICYQSPAFEGGYRSAQAIVKLENGEVPDLTKLYFGCNATTLSTPTTLTPLGDGFYLMKREGFKQDGSNDLVSIVSKGVTVYISEAYLENNKEFCSNILNSDNDIVYDCSGYNNNGKLYSYDSEGSISVISDSPRYDRSIFLNSSAVNNAASGTVCIYGHCGLTLPNQMSVAFWCKPTANGYRSTTGQGQFCTTKYTLGSLMGTDYQGSAMNHRDNTIDINDSSSTAQCRLSFIPTLNEWHHYAVTYDGQTGRIYKDGVETQNKSFDSPKTLDSFIGVIIGLSRAGNVWRRNKSQFSDFRIYATCLSQPDILELYNTSALIDNKGNGYSYKFDEISKNLFTLENWNEGCKITLSYVNRNGSPSIPLNPAQFYYGSGDSRNLQFQTKFASNTQYKFDLWIDSDDAYNSVTNKNVEGGIRVYYTDRTSAEYTVLTNIGNRDNPIGWVHKIYYSTPGKSISGIGVHYNTAINVYYRWDSMIIPIESTTEIKNNGIMSTGSFRENVDVAQICKGDNFDTNQLIEI